MAQPIDFPKANATFQKPEGMTDAECAPLRVMKTSERIISCWKLTPEELAEIQRTGAVWLSVWGTGTPPVLIEGKDPTQGFQSFALPTLPATEKPKGDDDGKTQD